MTGLRALTVREPWASPIVDGHKPTENRSQGFPKGYRGPLLIHTAKGWSVRGQRDPRVRAHYDLDAFEAMPRGQVIGVVDVVDIHPAWDCCEPWGEATYPPANPEQRPPGIVTHLTIEQPIRIEPIDARGALGLWRPDDDLLLEVAHALATLVSWDQPGARAVAGRADVEQLYRLLADDHADA